LTSVWHEDKAGEVVLMVEVNAPEPPVFADPVQAVCVPFDVMVCWCGVFEMPGVKTDEPLR
jgi:hypothetical protein